MVSAFSELGQAVSRRWERESFAEEAFSEIAEHQLARSDLLQNVEPADVINWLMRPISIPRQNTYEFGQPAIVVYEDTGFYIQVLFWADGTTSIHEHAFAGAFGVLSGSSVHTTYGFERTKGEWPGLVAGSLKFQTSELLKQGAVRPIQFGGSTHALFHLDRPSVSVVVRTPGSAKFSRQYDYLHPGLGIDPQYSPNLAVIQLRMLETLLKTDPVSFWNAAHSLAARAEPWLLYKILALGFRKGEDQRHWKDLVEIAHKRQPDLAEDMLTSLTLLDREKRILALRASIHDPVHRFFLALLLSVPTRDLIFRLIAERFPTSSPDALVIRWLSEIFTESKVGLKLTPLTVHLLRVALQEQDFAKARERLSRFLEDSGEAKANEQKLKASWDKLLDVDLLKPLFAA